jgi:hypothetical protein
VTAGRRTLVPIAATVILAVTVVGIAVTWLMGGDDGNMPPGTRVTRSMLVKSFSDQGVTLELQFAAQGGPVDATYTVAGEPLGRNTPVVVELFRLVRRAKERDAFLEKHGTEGGRTLTVLRSKNAVAALNDPSEDLADAVTKAMDSLD